jgi:hypothetical protein
MNIKTLIYLVFTVITVVFTGILAGRYWYSKKHRVSSVNDVDVKGLPSRRVASFMITLAHCGVIREDILKNSAKSFDEDAYLRSFISFLTPDNVRAIKSAHAELFDA